MRPRLIRMHKPPLMRISIWTFHNRTMGKSARAKSDMIDMMAWEMMILSNCASVKHVAGVRLFHAPAIGLH